MRPGWRRRPALLVLAVALLAGPIAAGAVESDEEGGAREDADYVAGRKAVEARDWPGAIRLLSAVALRDTRNADIQNYLGYAYRNSGELALSFKHYARALQLNPRHRGAHEYLGEAYLMIGNLGKAEEHLQALKAICLIPCPEYGLLEAKVAEFRKGGPAR
jgi:tetratricopeptide (TPR) repeat protein